MTRNIFKIAFASVLTLGAMTSCNLDLMPQGTLTTENTWEQVSDAEQYESGLYSSFRGVWGGLNTEYQGDLFNAGVDFGNNGGAEHRWDFNDETDTWINNYSTIKECNNIINNIDKVNAAGASDEETAANKAALNNIKGEAYFVRAVCYHNIVIRYAKDYEASTAAQDPGLPLVESIDINAKPNRSTLQATYDFIKNDIAQARQLMTNTDAGADKSQLTTDDIDLFEARVDLYMDNYGEADKLAQKVISSGKYPLITDKDAYASMWLNDAGSEIMFQPGASLDELPTAKGGKFINYNSTKKAYQPFFIPSQWVIDLYSESDIRKSSFFKTLPVQEGTMEAPVDIQVLYKFPGNPALKKTADEISYYNANKVFRSAEAYLISAEARYKNKNEDGAREVLNQFRTARGEAATTATGAALFTEIKDEWTREFIGEGFRLDNLKRWHDGFKRHDPQDKTPLVSTDPEHYINLSIAADNYRWVWEIPSNDRLVNKGIVPNWDSNK